MEAWLGRDTGALDAFVFERGFDSRGRRIRNRYFVGEESTLIQLVDSALKLGPGASLAALKFLCWRVQTLSEDDLPYYAIAILLLAVSLGKLDAKSTDALMAAAHSGEVALSDLVDQCLKVQTWKDTTRRLLIESTSSSEALRRFGKALIGTTEMA